MEPHPFNQAWANPVFVRRKVLTVSDLHQRRHLFLQLAAAVAEHQPDVVAVVGDFLELEAAPLGAELLSVQEAAAALLALPCEVVLVRGEQEQEGWPAFEAAWRASGRALHALHGSAETVADLTFVGFPCLTGDASFYSKGRELPGGSYEAWLPGVLRATDAAGRMLWLMHEPPCPELAAACCEEWRRAILEYQPLQVVSGHDHLYPLTGPDSWSLGGYARVGNTLVANFGQRVDNPRGKLLYGVIDFEGRPGWLMTPKATTRYGGPRFDEPPLGW